MPRPTRNARTQSRGPYGAKLITALRRIQAGKVVDLDAVRAGSQEAQRRHQELASLGLPDVHPAFGYYVLAQRQLSDFIEQISSLPEVRAMSETVTEAEDEYSPAGPPMSPLTQSYFFCWALCDAPHGSARETFASAALDLVRFIGTNPNTLAAMETLAASRMGVWVHEGRVGDRVILRELVTDDRREAIVPAGHLGARGELWLTRVLPPPPVDGLPSVVFGTPYLLVRMPESPWDPREGWERYAERTLGPKPTPDRVTAWAAHMKHGPSLRYWPEYIFQAYVNHTAEVILLTGLPDITSSRPHAPRNW